MHSIVPPETAKRASRLRRHSLPASKMIRPVIEMDRNALDERLLHFPSLPALHRQTSLRIEARDEILSGGLPVGASELVGPKVSCFPSREERPARRRPWSTHPLGETKELSQAVSGLLQAQALAPG
jgi:hypothetical protein